MFLLHNMPLRQPLGDGHVGDRMIIAPPILISTAQIDQLVERATRALDEKLVALKQYGLMIVG